MITNELTKILIHAINGSFSIENKNAVIDFSKPISFFGANFVVSGLVHTQIDNEGNRKPIYCSSLCEKTDLSEVLPNKNNGLLFFERVPNSYQIQRYSVQSHYKKMINVSERFNVIVWYDRCRLGFDKCCYAYPQINLQLTNALTVCDFNVTNDLVKELSCETNHLEYRNVNVSVQNAMFMSDDIFGSYDYADDAVFNNGTCESIKLELSISYDVPLNCLDFPMYEMQGICECLI